MQLIENAEYAEALHHLDALLDQLSPGDRVVALLWKVHCLAAVGEPREARACVEEALAQVDVHSPLRVCLQLKRAFLLHAEEGPEKAVIELRLLLNRYAEKIKTPELLPVYVQAKTDLGNCLVTTGQYAEAIKELEEALSLQDRPLPRYYIHFWLGDAFHRLGDLDKAKDHFEHALTTSA